MKAYRTSITTKLTLLFLLVGISSVLIVGVYSFYTARRAIIQRTIDQLISVRAVKKQQIEYFLIEKERNLKFLAEMSDVRTAFEETGGKEYADACRSLITYYMNYGFSCLYLVHAGKPGKPTIRVISNKPGSVPESMDDRLKILWRRVGNSDSVCILDLFRRSHSDTLPVCLIGLPVRDQAGRLMGALALEISSRDINRIMLQNNSRIGLGQSGEAYLVGDDFLMRSASRFLSHSVLSIPVKTESARLAQDGKTGALETPDYRNIPVFSAYEPVHIPGLHWIVLAEIDYKEAVVPVERLRNDILLVSVIISIFILAIARLITRMVTQPIIHLRDAATKIGDGDFSSKVRVRARDEIGALGRAFNKMIDRIRDEQQRRLSAVYDGQEMERQRISRELHDGMGQKLVAAKLQLENCTGQDPGCLQGVVADVKSQLAALVEDTRQISNDLMPSSLHDLGLDNALQNLCRTIQRQSNLEIDFYSHCPTFKADDKTTVYLYRIAQEAIANVIKHAGATAISMQLTESRDHLIFILEDNGTGFNAGEAGFKAGNGLYNMRERTELLGGILNIETEHGKGTTLRVKIPRKK